MTRSMPRRHDHFAERETVAILYLFWLKAVLCASLSAGVNLRRIQSRTQFARTAHKIRVNMRLENVCDREPSFARHVHIDIDICSWIEHCSHSLVIIADQVREFCDPFCLNCLEHQRHRQDLT